MRTIWNGSINFGLVNIPIGLAVAQQRQDTSFRTLHRECGTPIKQKRYCPFHERDVEADELVKGWEFSKGQFVLVEESDLEAVAVQRSQSIDILRFVPVEQQVEGLRALSRTQLKDRWRKFFRAAPPDILPSASQLRARLSGPATASSGVGAGEPTSSMCAKTASGAKVRARRRRDETISQSF